MSFRNDDDFDSESYVKVNVRLMEFWAKYPDGRLETHAELLNNGVLKMVAKLFKTQESTLPIATGHSFLESFDTEKVGEYTETVAVGRALANAGFKIEKSIASAQEMTRFKERQSAKAEAPREMKPAPKAPEETPDVPKKLTTSRIFKPLPKSEQQTGGK